MRNTFLLSFIFWIAKQVKLFLWFTFILFSAACSGLNPTHTTPELKSTTASGTGYSVRLNPADFVSGVDNSYFPLVSGSKYIYEAQNDEGLERTEVEVLAEKRLILGVAATEVRDRVFLDGDLIEDTLDWYAQDKEGNVWYMGEEVKNYEGGVLKYSAGSWKAGVDGALPGIIMYVDPAAHLGETYHQEYYQGKAEDMAELVSVDETVNVPYGSFTGAVMTRDYTPLEPGLEEFKYYAAGIGMVQEVNQAGGEALALVEFSNPSSSLPFITMPWN